jgi:hypothetical protein
MKPQEIVQAYADGMISRREAETMLDSLRIRGAFDLFAGKRFHGYDYASQQWLDITAA